MQGSEEAFTEFLQRLSLAMNRAITDSETRQPLVEILVFENANVKCKRVIRPFKACEAPIDEWIREIADIGSQEYNANIIGQIIARNIGNQNA